ncbi:MAG: 6-carboxytetrahydropterin synthase [Candidatus Thiosymbion ectosymbiont of Robbea hypermnestra]|nr:6-carboxytetrahydropterin synthase [Candidatus Thiosymbion ectosymbiont of Robbea hypermnestra]
MTTRLLHVAAVPFEAARRVPILPAEHRARRLHGHSFLARVRAELPAGWAPFPGGETDALRDELAHCVAALDYRELNERLPVPTDENLARWLRARLRAPGIQSVGIQSTRDQGADLDGGDHAHLWRRFRFEAAHQLPKVPPDHKCGRMHGHGFEVILHANQDLENADMGLDFDQLDALWAPLHRTLHYSCLNDLPGLANPTSELLSVWLWERLKPTLPALSWISVYETARAGCHYDGQHFRIWTEQRFESALRLTRAPDGSPRRRRHGHSYLLRLHLSAPLDRIMGWVRDYGDIKERFRPLLARLDHHPLETLPRLQDADPASLARWLRQESADLIPALDRIDLHQTPGCGVLLCWGQQGPALPT